MHLTGRARRAFLRAKRSFAEDGPLLVVCVALVAFGVWIRAVNLGLPHSLTWDEHHFVENARNYIHHQHDWNDHPPLGKLLMAPWMLAFGDTSTSFRMSSLVFGLASIAIAGSLAAHLYRDRRAGWLASAFIAADGFCIAFSKTALLDGVLTALVLLTAWLVVTGRSLLRLAIAALVIGLAANVKESGFALGLPVLLLSLLRPHPVLRAGLLALAPVAFTGAFCLGLWLAREPASVVDAWRTALHFVKMHHDANTFLHPLSSHWYTWFLPIRPITLSYEPAGRHLVRVMTTLGNLALWWAAPIALVAAGALSVRAGIRCWRARSFRARVGRTSRASVVLFSFAMTMLAPWIIGSQDSYIVHYLPVYATLLILVAGFTARVYRRRRVPALAFVCVTALVSAFYAPVWGKLRITPTAFVERLFFPGWR
jgi:dolichyl-phosphate-mannose--protein O-mannosyl transferase